jgi:hypothetical protein
MVDAPEGPAYRGWDEVDEKRRRGLIEATLQKSMFQTEMKRWKINA